MDLSYRYAVLFGRNPSVEQVKFEDLHYGETDESEQHRREHDAIFCAWHQPHIYDNLSLIFDDFLQSRNTFCTPEFAVLKKVINRIQKKQFCLALTTSISFVFWLQGQIFI